MQIQFSQVISVTFVILTLLIVRAHASIMPSECQVKLLSLEKQNDLTINAMAFIKTLFEHGYLNESLLLEIKDSNLLFNFVDAAQNQGLFNKNYSASVSFRKTCEYLFIKNKDSINKIYINQKIEELLQTNREKTEKVSEVKKETHEILVNRVLITAPKSEVFKRFSRVDSYSIPVEAKNLMTDALGNFHRTSGVNVKGKFFSYYIDNYFNLMEFNSGQSNILYNLESLTQTQVYNHQHYTKHTGIFSSARNDIQVYKTLKYHLMQTPFIYNQKVYLIFYSTTEAKIFDVENKSFIANIKMPKEPYVLKDKDGRQYLGYDTGDYLLGDGHLTSVIEVFGKP